MTISLRSPISSVVITLALAAAAAFTGCDRDDDHVYKPVAPKVSVASASTSPRAPAGKPITARSYQIGVAPEGAETGAGKPTAGPSASVRASGGGLSADEREERADDRADRIEESADRAGERLEDRHDRIEEASEGR